jgi:hypothetical protein
MPFAYYRRLDRAQKAIYRRSDATTKLLLPGAKAMQPLVDPIRRALADDDRLAAQRATSALCRAICDALGVPRVTLRVLARRPANAAGELHGLYEREEGKRAVIRIWMRTAAHVRPVALRTFVRTVLHELCHHLDYDLLELEDSFHTEGFFRRESSLARQLLPPSTRRRRASVEPATAKTPKRKRQLELPF